MLWAIINFVNTLFSLKFGLANKSGMVFRTANCSTCQTLPLSSFVKGWNFTIKIPLLWLQHYQLICDAFFLQNAKMRTKKKKHKKTWRRKWQPTAVFLPGKVHGQRSLVGWSPWGYMTEHVCTRVEGDGLVAMNWWNNNNNKNAKMCICINSISSA